MLPFALQVGIDVIEYWDYTYGEIVASIKAHKENDRLRVREIAGFNYGLANLIGLSVARIMDDKAEFPSLKKAYPNIFSDLKEESEVEPWKVTKAKMLQNAEIVNDSNRRRGDVK